MPTVARVQASHLSCWWDLADGGSLRIMGLDSQGSGQMVIFLLSSQQCGYSKAAFKGIQQGPETQVFESWKAG